MPRSTRTPRPPRNSVDMTPAPVLKDLTVERLLAGPEYPIRIPVIEGRPTAEAGRLSIFTGEVPATVAMHFDVKRIGEDGGFQRPLDRLRVRSIARAMTNGQPYVYAGVLAFLPPDSYRIERMGSESTSLILTQPPVIVEGQHRLASAQLIASDGKVPEWTESVRFVAGASMAELAYWYLLINTQMRKVKPSNIFANVATMEGTQFGRKSWLARVAMMLAQEPPFRIESDDGAVVRLIAWDAKDGGRIQPLSLYDCLDAMCFRLS